MRKIEFANEEYYHIFNRGVDKRKVFLDSSYYQRFLLSMELLNDEKDGVMEEWRNFKKCNSKAMLSDFRELSSRKKLVEFIAYCLNPNHYHFIMRQVADRGIERFMHKLGTSYTNYFNTKNKRTGSLFQGNFKAIHIDSNEYLLYLSAYVNKNNFIHGYRPDDKWEYSSLHEYAEKQKKKFCSKGVILGQFGNKKEYLEFMRKNALYLKKKKADEKYLLE
jgi:putative transposase